MQVDVINHPQKRRVVRLQGRQWSASALHSGVFMTCKWTVGLDDAWRSCTLGFFLPFVFLVMVSVFLLKFSQSLNVVFMHKVKNFARFCVSYSLSWWRGEGGAAARNDSSWSPCWQANNRRISATPSVPYHVGTCGIHCRNMSTCDTLRTWSHFGIPTFQGHVDSTKEIFPTQLKDPLGLHHANNHHVFPI
jgi:hypothetical protein